MINIRPEDIKKPDHTEVTNYGEYGVIFDGEGYYGTYWPSEYDYSEMCSYEEACQWCLNSIINGGPIQ